MNKLYSAFIAIILAVSLAAMAGTVQAGGETILTVTGKIAKYTSGKQYDFNFEYIEKLGLKSFIAKNNWLEGTHKFEGVKFSALLETVGATGDTLHAVALNDYAVDIPVNALIDGPALLVTRIDGDPVSVRDKGPLWIVYPQDDDTPQYQRAPYVNYMIWQLRSIDVR